MRHCIGRLQRSAFGPVAPVGVGSFGGEVGAHIASDGDGRKLSEGLGVARQVAVEEIGMVPFVEHEQFGHTGWQAGATFLAGSQHLLPLDGG